MELSFEKGTPSRPRGHALLYFRDYASGRLYATYVVVLPIPMELAKYLPPFLASHVGPQGQQLAAFALPPVPEETHRFEELARLAGLRDDDLVFGGGIKPEDLPEQMQAVNDAVQRYAQLWAEYSQAHPATPVPQSQDEDGVGVNEVLYGLMSERDKLAEMSKLVARLRFAVEGHDAVAAREAEEEIAVLAKYLPASYDVPGLVSSTRDATRRGGEIAKLRLERCYRLCAGDARGAQELEERIKALQAS